MPTRAPGQKLTLSDQELLDYEGPLDLLTPNQRRKRRKLRYSKSRQDSALKRARAQSNKETHEPERVPGGKLKRCAARRKKDGAPCRGLAVHGSEFCMAHLPKEVKADNDLLFATFKPRNKTTAPELMRQVLEKSVAEVLGPYLKSIGLELRGFDEDGEPVVRKLPGAQGKGLMLHGESKDGDIKMSSFPNLTAQVQVVERMFDRVYGKARITTVLEGGEKPVRVEPVRSEDRAREVASLLARSGALPPGVPGVPGVDTHAHTHASNSGGDGEVIEGTGVVVELHSKKDDNDNK